MWGRRSRGKRSVAVLIGFATLCAPAAAWATSRTTVRAAGSADASLVALPAHRVIDTTGVARREPAGACGDAANASRLFFHANADGTLRATTSASGARFDPVLILRDGAGRVVACNDDANGTAVEARLSVAVRRGRQYVLEVAGQAGSTGRTALAVSISRAARPTATGTATIRGHVTSKFDGGAIG